MTDKPVNNMTDEQMIAAAASMSTRDFSALDGEADGDGYMLLRFAIADQPGVYGIRLPLPSSPAPKPWLYTIPTDAAHAASMLATFIDEEVATGCARWARMTQRGEDVIFQLAPYGFRHADDTDHRRLLRSSGPDGWWGPMQENDDPAQTPGGREHARRQQQQLTYLEVGATAGVMPPGYQTVDLTQPIGQGQEWFETAAQRVLSWDMHRRAGLLVNTLRPEVDANADAVLEIRLGPWWMQAPVRVVEVVREPTTQGFAYGTLPGHPECGEERFLVHIDANQLVTAQIRAFSRPGRWFTRLGHPIARRVQEATTQRYLNALIQYDAAG